MWRCGTLPTTWQGATIVPIIKPQKLNHILDSYRPILFTAILCNIMELMIYSRVINMLIKEKYIPLA